MSATSRAHASARERLFLAGLFAFGLAVRWLFADGDFIGDDAWYLYLSRSFGVEPGVQGEQPWFHLANRPAFYAFYHLSSYFGLTGFRLLGCGVGAALPWLAFRAARRFGASFFAAALTACLLCVQTQQLIYSAAVFPDVLAAAFALAGCWALAAGSLTAALALAALCVFTKESFVLVPVLFALLARSERLQLSWRQWALCALPVAYVCMITAITLATPSLRLQGWSTTPFTLKHARNMGIGIEVWPLLAWLLWQRQTRTLLLWLGLPLFYLAWNRVLGRGLAPWYVVGPAALSSVAAALGLDFVRSQLQRPQLQAALVALCVLALAPGAVLGLARVRAQARQLHGFPRPRAADEVVALIAQRAPSRLLLVDCFWAYRYSHLRGPQPSAAVWWFGAHDTETVLSASRAADMVVACRMPGHEPVLSRLQEPPFDVLYEDADYLVLESGATLSRTSRALSSSLVAPITVSASSRAVVP